MLYVMQNDFIPLSMDESKMYYIEKYERFNGLKDNWNENINIEKEALMIFLNKTCFNGYSELIKKVYSMFLYALTGIIWFVMNRI